MTSQRLPNGAAVGAAAGSLSFIVGGEAVIFLSHRGPVQYDRTDGERTTGRGGGGLVTALSGLAGRLEAQGQIRRAPWRLSVAA